MHYKTFSFEWNKMNKSDLQSEVVTVYFLQCMEKGLKLTCFICIKLLRLKYLMAFFVLSIKTYKSSKQTKKHYNFTIEMFFLPIESNIIYNLK